MAEQQPKQVEQTEVGDAEQQDDDAQVSNVQEDGPATGLFDVDSDEEDVPGLPQDLGGTCHCIPPSNRDENKHLVVQEANLNQQPLQAEDTQLPDGQQLLGEAQPGLELPEALQPDEEGVAAEETVDAEGQEKADYEGPAAGDELEAQQLQQEAPVPEQEEAPVAGQAEAGPSQEEPEGAAYEDVHQDIFGSDSDGEDVPRNRMHESEAEDEDEEDEFEAMFQTGKKKRKREGTTAEILMTVEALIANMEVAAEMDIAANEEGKPAVNKIKLLSSVEEKLALTNLHRELLDCGILGVLKLWIEPLPDMSLPNVKVRTAVFKMLHKLPIDLALEGRKAQLKKSELGRYVMFYSKLGDENLTNRQLARGLVEKWSRPIFDQHRENQDEELQEREQELAQLRKRRRQEAQAAAPKPPPGKDLKPGDAGFRWHASIPAPARLDYMRRPENMAVADGEAVRGKAKPKDKMSKRLAAMSRKGGKKGPGEGKVSLQGRGIFI